ncbi:hypothetical protein [Pedobacter sp. KLB.chiD]|uniref:hypothetical protein n=1 Tax=Pedobacter sp. KLB.chiD TaxID=3387402 RepID=UPI00399AE6B6
MSTYFQCPAIDEYPKLIDPLQIEAEALTVAKHEDSLNKEQILERRDYLTLKQL